MKIAKCFAQLLCLVLPWTAHAGGLFVYEVSASDVRLASAGWSARANDPSTVFTNPAGMSLLNCNSLQIGIEPIYAHVNFSPNGLTNVAGEHGDASTWLPAGNFYATTRIDDCWTAGFAALGYWGSGLNYGRNWVGRYYLTEALLEGISAIPSIAYQVNDCLSVGAGINVMYSILLSKAAVNNVLDGLPDGSVRLLDTRCGAGVILGGLYQFDACTRVGFQYMSPVQLHFKDKPKFHEIGPTLTADLGPLLNSTAKVDIQVPSNFIVSVYHEVTPCTTVMADIGWQQWSKFGEAEIMLANPAATTVSAVGKFKDTWHAAAGLEYQYDCDLLMSAGVAYDSSMVTTQNRTFSLPVGAQWRFGTGFQYLLNECVQFDAAYELVWSGNLSADQNRGPLAGHVSGKYTNLCIQFVNLSLTYNF